MYSIFLGKQNVVDLTEVLWQDFRKSAINRKPHGISSMRFWALTIQQLYRERNAPIHVDTIPKEVFLLLNLSSLITFQTKNLSDP